MQQPMSELRTTDGNVSWERYLEVFEAHAWGSLDSDPHF